MKIASRMLNVVTALVLVALSSGIAALVVLSRQSAPPATVTSNAEKLRVVASFYPLWFFSTEIGGDRAVVTNVTPAGAEPHDYEPTARDIADIESSDMLVLNGANLEPWGSDVQKNIDPARTRLVVAGDGLASQSLDEQGTSIVDPHLWLSPALAKKEAARIADAYAAIDPAHADAYRQNASALSDRLDALSAEYSRGLAHCATHDIVTSHAAFGYLATDYGLRQTAIAGLSPDAEPSPQALAGIAAFVKKNNVSYIFFESLVSPKLADTIATEVGAKTLVLDPLEGLTPDEMARGEDYFSVMRENLKNLQTALQCESQK